jgi:putative ABC transport system ATP-binding protein
MIVLQDVSKVYRQGRVAVPALRSASLEIRSGEYVVIRGPSGSGKSTLLNLVALLDVPTSGRVLFDGVDVATRPETERSHIRNAKLGIVFQRFNLIPNLTAWQNVSLPGKYGTVTRRDRRARAVQLLSALGLDDRVNHLPSELSGGEEQRVAIARALFMSPKLLLADEPTGNLDSQTGAEVMEQLKEIHRNGGTLLLATHDRSIGSEATREVALEDGAVIRDATV